MTEVWDDFAHPLGDKIADALRDMVRRFESGAERSQQRSIGPSGVGNPCTRCLARQVLGVSIAREFDDPWCRIIGTAVHSWLDDAAGHDNATTLTTAGADRTARWHPEQRVHPHPDLLPKGGRTDLYDEQTKTVIDHKVVGAAPLAKYKINGPGQQYRAQVQVYGLGCHRLGLKVENVGIAFWNRGGRLSDLYVWTEPYDAQYAIDVLLRYRTIRDQALAIGAQIIPLLPADQSCWDCGGKDVSADELAVINTQPNPAHVA